MLESEGDFSGVEACTLFRESNLLAKVKEELSAVQEIGDEVE